MKKIKILLLGIVSVFLLLGTAFAIEATPADREAIEKVCRQYLLDYDAAYLFGKEPTTSARPPVLINGTASDATNKMFFIRTPPLHQSAPS